MVMKFQYNINKDSLIIAYENKMLIKYINYINNLDIINDFYPLCDKYNCSIKIGLSWINEHNKKYSNCRVPFTKGYYCCVYFELQKSGDVLCVKSYNNEADYYPISTSWIITASSNSFYKKTKFNIELCSNKINEECIEDIYVLLKILLKADENDVFFTQDTGTQGDGSSGTQGDGSSVCE